MQVKRRRKAGNVSKAVERIKKEVREILVTAMFFSTGFCLIILADRLAAEGSGIPVASFGRAIVGGLIVAKVLLLADLLPLVHAFPHKPLIHNIVWKTAIYVLASLVFRYAEPLIEELFRGAGAAAAHRLAIQQLVQPRFWASEIWVAVLLLIFVTMRELARVEGKERLRLIFLGR